MGACAYGISAGDDGSSRYDSSWNDVRIRVPVARPDAGNPS